jgi:hypothetical protein
MTPEQQAMDLNPELLGLSRERKLAELLMAQGLQQPQGQMISGYYVAPSVTQQLNPLANILAGQAIGNRADTKQVELATALRGRQQQEINQFGELLKTDPSKAYQFAAQSQVPQLRDAGLKKMMPQEFDLVEGARRFTTMPDGTTKEIAAGSKKFIKPLEIPTGNGTLILDAESFEKKGFVPKVLAAGESVNPQEAPLRNKFLDQIQPHIQISQAYGKITNAPDTAAGDMSKIFGFMKILDPGSTVREGEYASAEQTRGLPDAVVAQYNKALSGRRLTAEQREKFDQAAGDLVTSQKKQFDQQKDFFTSVATSAKANPNNIIFDPYKGLDIKVSPPKPPEPTKEGINFFGRANSVSGNWSIKSVK